MFKKIFIVFLFIIQAIIFANCFISEDSIFLSNMVMLILGMLPGVVAFYLIFDDSKPKEKKKNSSTRKKENDRKHFLEKFATKKVGIVLIIIQFVAIIGETLGTGLHFDNFFTAFGFFIPGILGILAIVSDK